MNRPTWCGCVLLTAWIVAGWLVMATPFAAPIAVAQEKKVEKTEVKKDAKEQKAHDDITALKEAFLKAIDKKDADAIIALVHPDIVMTVQDGKELKTHRKHEAVRDYLARHLTGPSPNIKSLKPDVKVDDWTILYGDDTGVAFGKSEDKYVMADGREFTLPTRWSTTLVKTDDGSWKIANLHVANNLFDNPVLDAYKKSMTWFLIGAGVAGLVVGWILAKMMGGKA